MFLTFGMIGVSLVASVVVLALHYAGREPEHRRVDKVGAVVFPALFALLLVLVVR